MSDGQENGNQDQENAGKEQEDAGKAPDAPAKVDDAAKNGADEAGKGGSENGDAPDWRAAIEDGDLKKHAERFTSPVDLVKAHFDLRKELSKAIVPPAKDASEEDVAKYLKKIGVPESPDKYEFEVPEGTEPSEMDKAFQETMGKAFHEARVSKDQAKALNTVFNEFTKAQQTAVEEAHKTFADETEAKLKEEWPGEEYDRNTRFANSAAKEMFKDEFEDFRLLTTADGRYIGDHPVMVKALARIGREMGEDRIGGGLTDADRDSVQDQIRETRQKRHEAMNRGDHKKAQEIDRELTALYGRLEKAA